MTDTQTLHALYELHTRSANAGGEGFWPEEVRPYSLQGSQFYVYERYGGQASMSIHIQHTLDIVNAHAECWLAKQSFGQWSREGLGDAAVYELRGTEYQYITDAIRYEVERMEQETA